MKTLASQVTTSLRVLLAAVGLVVVSAPAQAAPASPDPALKLEIVDGKISTVTQNGKPMPATLRNIVALITATYPVSVTFAGIEDVLIPNLTLQIASRPASLDLAFTALAEASGHKFRMQRFGESDILLMPDMSSGPARSVEVFNLSSLLIDGELLAINHELGQTEKAYADARKQFADQNPRVEELRTKLKTLEAQRRNVADRVAMTRDQKIAQIQEMAAAAARALKSSENPPEFQFHPGANLLIVIGGPDSIDLTRKIIAALEKNPH